jgi:hypothetical protein
MKTTKQRLALYRAKAAKSEGRFADWHYWKSSAWSTPGFSRGDKGELYTESLDQIGDNLGDAHELNKGIRNTGWYANSFQDALIKGAVCKMRTARGTYYIPATYCTDWDGTTHYLGDAEIVAKGSDEDAHQEAIREAARRADRRAELEAEEAREYHAKDQAEQQTIAAREHIHELNRETLALIRKAKEAKRNYTPAVCKAIVDKIEDALEKRKAEFARIEELESDYWTAVSYY